MTTELQTPEYPQMENTDINAPNYPQVESMMMEVPGCPHPEGVASSPIIIPENMVESIKVNGNKLPVINHEVDIPVPTKASDLDNDESFVSESELSEVATSGSYDDLDNKPDIEDIAANVADSAVSAHNESETAHSDIRDEIETVKDIAEGANIAIVFDSYSDLVTFFNSESDTLKVGTNLYVKTIDVPDLWLSAVESTSVSYTYTTDEDFLSYINGNGQIGYYKFSELETQKVDLSNYATLTDLGTKVSKSGDTMTGDLTMDGTAVVIKISDTQLWRLKNNTTHLEVQYTQNGGTTWSPWCRWYATQDRFYFKYNNVYAGNPTDKNYRLQRYSEIFTTGIINDTKTWSVQADGSYSYVISDPVSGAIPNSFIMEWNVKCSLYSYQAEGKFNANTGYFECNGLTDITYEEAIIILCESSMVSMNNTNYRRSRTNLGVTMNSISLARQWQNSQNEIAFGANTSWNLGASSSSTTTFNPCQRLREIIYWRFSYIQGTFAPGGTDENNNLPSLRIIRVSGIAGYGPVGNIDLRSAPNFTLEGVQELVNKAPGNNSITFRFHTNVRNMCQADTTEYTYGGQTYIGIISYAAAKNITITN